MSTETLILGVLLIVSMMVIARIFRKGLGSFEQHFQDFRRNLQRTEKQVRDGNLSISLNEQMAVIRAALAEELDIAGQPAGYSMDAGTNPRLVRLHTPQGCFEISFNRKTARLHSQNRVLHGGGLWVLRGPDGENEIHTESLAGAMQHMHTVVRGGLLVAEEGEEFRRRFPA